MFQSIGKAVEIKVASVGLARSLEAAVVLAKADSCAAGRWKATRYRKGKLTLTAPSPVAAQELVLRKQLILRELQQVLGETVVTELFIRS